MNLKKYFYLFFSLYLSIVYSYAQIPYKIINTKKGDAQWAVAFVGKTQNIMLGGDGFLETWNTETQLMTEKLPLNKRDFIHEIVYSAENNYFLTGGNQARLWDAKNNNYIRPYEQAPDITLAIAFLTEKGGILVGGSRQDFPIAIIIPNTDTKKDKAILDIPSDAEAKEVTSIVFSTQGNMIALANRKHTLIYKQPDNRLLFQFENEDINAETKIVFSHDSRYLFTSNTHLVNIYDTKTGEKKSTKAYHTEPIHALLISPDGQYLITAGADKMIKIFHIETESVLHTLKGHEGIIKDLSISASGETLASIDNKGKLLIWDISSLNIHAKIPETTKTEPAPKTENPKNELTETAQTSIKEESINLVKNYIGTINNLAFETDKQAFIEDVLENYVAKGEDIRLYNDLDHTHTTQKSFTPSEYLKNIGLQYPKGVEITATQFEVIEQGFSPQKAFYYTKVKVVVNFKGKHINNQNVITNHQVTEVFDIKFPVKEGKVMYAQALHRIIHSQKY